MQSDKDIKLGKFISLILRHSPETIGIKLDENGWADVRALIAGINRSGRHIDMATLERIVAENNKSRYSFDESKKRLRANQGHSIEVDVELKAAKPPALLYHGTASRFCDAIFKEGLKKQSRNHVHLSAERETALAVGRRHGSPVILSVDTAAMSQNGYIFYLSENGVWLTDNVPPAYLKQL